MGRSRRRWACDVLTLLLLLVALANHAAGNVIEEGRGSADALDVSSTVGGKGARETVFL